MNFDYLEEIGMISAANINTITYVNSPNEAFDALAAKFQNILDFNR